MKRLTAIAFIPIEDVPAAFDEVSETAPNGLEVFINYVEETYVRGPMRRGRRRGRALFPPSYWSVATRTGNIMLKPTTFSNLCLELGLPRTTNSVESWHSRWNTLVSRAHVGIFTLIKQMQKEEHEVGGEIQKVERGLIDFPVDARELRLRAILEERDQRDRRGFLAALAANF